VRAWLELLLQAGINLEEYGRREFWLHLKGRVNSELSFADLGNRRKAKKYREATENSLMIVDADTS
jgi:hypothetical protein